MQAGDRVVTGLCWRCSSAVSLTDQLPGYHWQAWGTGNCVGVALAWRQVRSTWHLVSRNERTLCIPGYYPGTTEGTHPGENTWRIRSLAHETRGDKFDFISTREYYRYRAFQILIVSIPGYDLTLVCVPCIETDRSLMDTRKNLKSQPLTATCAFAVDDVDFGTLLL